jgi:vancomycin resistance protein YoaR
LLVSRSSVRRSWHTWAAAALAAMTLAGVFLAVEVIVIPRGCIFGTRLCEGLELEGMPLALGADLPALLAIKARELSERSLVVSVMGVPNAGRSMKLGAFGATLDTERMAKLGSSVGHVGSFIDRLVEARRARRGEIDVARAVRLDTQVAEGALSELKDEVDELPIAARVDLVHGGVIPEVPGYLLDLDDAFEKIRAAALSGAPSVEFKRLELMPRVSRDFVEHVAIGEPLSRFQTWFSRRGDQQTRAQNIDTATARLDGVVLLPKELFSFNSVIGPRTVDNGFSRGWEIFKGEMVEGIGGGTCQVASTLHASALLAGLDIIERLPHSRPSAYITMGLDATVVYPVVDLKLRNPYDFPIVVHGWVEGGKVTFELLGRERPARVTFGREVLSTRPFTRKVDEKPGIPFDRAVRKQHGIRGYKILRTRTIAYRDGTARRESNIDFYPPTTELYLVAPGADPDALLPPFVESPDPFAPVPEQEPSAGATSGAASTPAALVAASATAAAEPGAGSSVSALAGASAGSPPAASPPGELPSIAASTAAHIIEAPGVHPPRAEQPKKVVIYSLPGRH